jgi:MFS family permease
LGASDRSRPATTAVTAEAPALPRPTWVRYQVLTAVCVLALLTYVQRNGFASTGTGLKADLGLSGWQWGVLMAAFLVGYASFEVPWGVLGDRLGARHLLTLLVLGWSLLTAALALVGLLPAGTALPFYTLLALRFLFGVFQAGGFPGISRVLADWAPLRERATAQGLIWMFSRLGGAVAPFLLLTRTDGGSDWPVSFVLLGALGLLWCAAFWPWFRDRPEQMKQVNAAELDRIAAGRAARPTGRVHIPWKQLLRSGSVRALCLAYGCGAFSATFFITLLPAYLREQRHLPPEAMRWLSSLPLACGVVGCAAGGLFSDWLVRRGGDRTWGRRCGALVGLAGAGAALLATNWAHDTWLLAALLSATFFCNDLAMGPAWASCADIGERYAGTLGGAMNMVGNLGAALGALIAGALLGKEFVLQVRDGAAVREYLVAGNHLVFFVFACSFWLAALCWFGVDVSRPLSAPAEPAGH